jgi:hypothetical protein
MIQANGLVLGFLGDYFRQALGYMEVLQRSAVMNPLGLPLDWMKFILPNLTPPTGKGDGSVLPAKGSEAEALARRVAELEQRLDEMKAGGDKPNSKDSPRMKGRGKSGPATASGSDHEK